MRISLIVAMDRNRVIGREGDMPWRLPADLKHFKKITMGKPLIMGRKTHESIGRPLPGRRNLVITRNPDFGAEGCEVFSGLEEALAACAGEEEVMIIGGGQLYAEALPQAECIYLTRVDAALEGDTWFPELDEETWETGLSIAYPADEQNEYGYAFERLTRVTS